MRRSPSDLKGNDGRGTPFYIKRRKVILTKSWKYPILIPFYCNIIVTLKVFYGQLLILQVTLVLVFYKFHNIHWNKPMLESLYNAIPKAYNFTKENPTQVFSCEYCKIFKKAYFEEHLRTAASNFYTLNHSNPTYFRLFPKQP